MQFTPLATRLSLPSSALLGVALASASWGCNGSLGRAFHGNGTCDSGQSSMTTRQTVVLSL